MIPIIVHNDDMFDLFVDLVDLNTATPNAVLSGARLNVDQSMPVAVQEDGGNQANVAWTATRADDASIVKSGTEQIGMNAIVDIDVFGA